jgi:hypothetical protein
LDVQICTSSSTAKDNQAVLDPLELAAVFAEQALKGIQWNK